MTEAERPELVADEVERSHEDDRDRLREHLVDAQRGHYGWQGLRFLVVALIAYGANLALLAGLVALDLDKVLAQAIAVVLVTPLNFVGNKLWSFRSRA